MAFTIAQLKDDLEGVLHGTTLSKVRGVNNLINRAARQLLLDVDPQETKRTTPIVNAVYDNVFDYTAPVDLKGNKIIDIRPQVNREIHDNVSQTYQEQFDLKKPNNFFNIVYRDNVRFLRFSKALTSGLVIHDLNGISTNGTWTVGDDATNLTEDKFRFITSGVSLNFDLDGLGTNGFITNSTFSAVDLSEHEDISSLFLFLFVPDVSAFTSVDLRWGSSASDYWTVTATTPQVGTFLDGWNLVRFDWNGATEVGTPVSSAVDFLRVNVIYDGVAETDYRVDNITSRLGTIFEVDYYSKNLFTDSSSVINETITDDTDTINLETDSFNLLVDKSAEFAAQQMQGEDSVFDVGYFKGVYDTNLRKYKKQYPSEIEKPRQSYYRMPRRKYGPRVGGFGVTQP